MKKVLVIFCHLIIGTCGVLLNQFKRVHLEGQQWTKFINISRLEIGSIIECGALCSAHQYDSCHAYALNKLDQACHVGFFDNLFDFRKLSSTRSQRFLQPSSIPWTVFSIFANTPCPCSKSSTRRVELLFPLCGVCLFFTRGTQLFPRFPIPPRVIRMRQLRLSIGCDQM